MSWLSIDIETKSPTDDKDLAVDFTRAEIISLAWWSPRSHGVAVTADAMKQFLKTHEKAQWIAHNGKFDAKVIHARLGIKIGIAWDTMLAESILPDRPESLDLETCVGKELGYPKWKSKELYHSMGTADISSVSELNLQDVEYTYKLFQKQYEKLEELGLLDYFIGNNLGMSSLNFLREVEERGIGFDYEAMQKDWKENLKRREEIIKGLRESNTDEVLEYERASLAAHPLKAPTLGAKQRTIELYNERLRAREEKYRFNWSSDKQVLWLLKEKLGFPCTDFTGKTSTSKDVLEFYRGQHPIIDPLLELRHNEHDANSFFSNWDYYHREGRLHPTYRMDVARTFRLSCTEPNLQQVKRDAGFRSLFVAKPGHRLMVVDYSQIEPRIIAHYSQDPVLSGIYQHNLDLYEVVARKVMGYQGTTEEFKYGKDKPVRAVAKEVALSSFYGIGPDKFAHRIRLKTGVSITPGQARGYLNGYFEMLSGVLNFKQSLSTHLEQNPIYVNFLGRKIAFKPHEFYHLAFNKLIQCTGSDINMYSQIDLDRTFKQTGMQTRCIHLVHDEAIFEYPVEEEENLTAAVQWIMAERYSQQPWNLNIPIAIEVKTGNNWSCK